MKNDSDIKSFDNKRTAIEKIKTVPELATILAEQKAQGKTIVQCHGVFDLLHPGHIRHLAQARQQGDILVVTVTADAHVNKGPGRPAFNQDLRAETLASLESVDYVAINEFPTAILALKTLRPDVYAKGSDYANADADDDISGNIVDETNVVHSFDGRVHFTNDITFSSSSLINEILLPFPPETDLWLKAFRKNRSEDDVLEALTAISDFNVLILGEAIIDEYVFCHGLGKTARDPILAFLNQSKETVAGGSLAVANHLGDFCNHVETIALVGEIDRHEEFMRSALHSNVTLHAITHQGAPTIRKRRFVDDHTGAKIFELYHMNDDPLDPRTESDIIDTVEKSIAKADVVIVADYGHGMMTPRVIEMVSRKAKFLVLNTQANAGNRGLNTISRYPRADYVCLSANEVEIETRLNHANPNELFLALSELIDCPRFTFTQGRLGTRHYENGIEVVEAPAVALKVVDRVGAGDAMLAITGPLVAKKTPWDIVALVGNAAGAEMVAELGNRPSLTKVGFYKHLSALLK